MKAALLIFVCVILVGIEATVVGYRSNCNTPIELTITYNLYLPTLLAVLNNGDYIEQNFTSTASYNIRNGTLGLSLAEFNIWPTAAFDYYQLSVIVGYDVPMALYAPNRGPSIICRSSTCTDAAPNVPPPYSSVHSVLTGGKFDLIFCPL